MNSLETPPVSNSPQITNKNLNMQTRVFNNGSSLRVSTDPAFKSNSGTNSPHLLVPPQGNPRAKSKSPREQQAVQIPAPTPIYRDIDEVIAKFRKRTNTCIIGANGKEYHQHWTAHYCTGSDEIEGILLIDHGSLVFKATTDCKGLVKKSSFKSKMFPFLAKPKKEVYTKTFADFEVDINLQDIAECHIMDFPIPCSKHSNKTEKVYLLQLCLTNHGDYSIEPELDKVLVDMKAKKVPYVSLFFNIRPEGDEIIPEGNQPSETLLKIQSKLEMALISFHENQEKSELQTDIPFFEFMVEKFTAEQRPLLRIGKQVINQNLKQRLVNYKEPKSPGEIKEKLKSSKNASKSTSDGEKSSHNSPVPKQRRIVIPTMLDQSVIVTNEQFGQIIGCAPDLYQMFEWKLLYSNAVHGTSFNNLMRRSAKANPFIVIIRDTNNNIFGAYGSEVLKPSQNYYGTGETFLFTFRKSAEINEHHWSKKNSLFIFANEDGIMFGAGPFYGLWIGNELTRGRTYACDTFDNQPLSDTTDFEISKIEVWSVIDPFSKSQ